MKKLIFAAALAALCSARAELLIQNNDRIPFLGDSITANGNRPAGYVNMVMKGLDSVWYGIQNIFQGMHGGALPYFRNVRICALTDSNK